MKRRNFIKTTTVSNLGIIAVPEILTGGRWKGANDRVNVAVIGIRGMGQSHIQSYQNLKNVKVAALCDVDENLFEPRVKRHFSDKGLQKPKLYKDMRKLFEDKSIDAVSIVTPNHWHALAGIWAIQEATNYFADGLSKVADHAKNRDVQILIEPLPKANTDVLNTLEEAIKIVDKIDHSSISSMFDFHNTLDETESMPDLIRKYSEYIHHVHIQNMDGTLISSDRIPENFIPVFRELKDLNYKKWVSLEVFDFSPGGKFIAEEGMKTFQNIENMIQ